MSHYERLWQNMLQQSFSPRDWFQGRDWEEEDHDEGAKMWVYRKIGRFFVVGFYSPEGTWHEESRHDMRTDAAIRVRWLNGGDEPI